MPVDELSGIARLIVPELAEAVRPVLLPPVAVNVATVPLQIAVADGVTVTAEGSGFTVMVKVTAVPVQPLALGVTVITAVPAAVGVKPAMLVTLVWLARPMAAPPLMSNVTPAGVPVRAIVLMAAPAQTVTLAGAVATGVGFTVTVTTSLVIGLPHAGVITTSYDPVAAGKALAIA